jgi:hypothetical protein
MSQAGGSYCLECRGGAIDEDTLVVSAIANHMSGAGNASTTPVTGVYVSGVAYVVLDSSAIRSFSQSGVWLTEPGDFGRLTLVDDTISENEYNGLVTDNPGCTSQVRWCTIDSNYSGVYACNGCLPDLGTVSDPGENSILTGNVYYVTNWNMPPPALYAQYNWWGGAPIGQKFFGDGQTIVSPWLTLPPGTQSASVSPIAGARLYPCEPNPFGGQTEIRYTLAQAGRTTLVVYDVSGRVVRTLQDGSEKPGVYSLRWDGRDVVGRLMPAGAYFFKMNAPGIKTVEKVVIVR